MTRQELMEIFKKLVQTDTDLSFLMKLDKNDLQTLVVCVRDGLEKR